jgi:integrase
MRGRPKRKRGEGSVWKRRDGRYGASALVVVDGLQRRRQITKATREAALEEIARLKRAGVIAGGKETFGAWLDEWLLEVRTSTRPKTFESYESTARLHLKPVCGDVALAKLEPKHISRAIAAARKAKLSPSSVCYVRTIARIALERAVGLGRVTRNVAKLTASVSVQRADYQPFTDAQFAAFLEAIKGERLQVAYLIAVLLGPRKGEILGMQWPDVFTTYSDTHQCTLTHIRIVHQVQRVDGALHVSAVKTKRSRRVLTLPPEVAELLRLHRKKQKEERMKAGERWVHSDHVFTTRVGTVIEPRNLLREYHAVLASAKLPRRSFHALRHETGSALLAAGVPLKAISALLGHTSEAFTGATYTHMVASIDAQVTAAASSRMRKKSAGAEALWLFAEMNK